MLPVPHANLFAKAEPKSNPLKPPSRASLAPFFLAPVPVPCGSTARARSRPSFPIKPVPRNARVKEQRLAEEEQAQLVTLRGRAPTPLSWTVPEAL